MIRHPCKFKLVSPDHHFRYKEKIASILPQSEFPSGEFGVKVNNGELAELVFECPDSAIGEGVAHPNQRTGDDSC
jgi:hypothetical protein